jgi:pantoate--beta-alanine ligase
VPVGVPIHEEYDLMQVLTTPQEIRHLSDGHRAESRRVGFVPTMGALHEGHLALVDEARRHADVVVVSIFVNPLQFDVRSDFDKYPRPIDDDLAACERAGVDAVYAPTAGSMYPSGFETRVLPGSLADVLEGAHRPGHFEGVTTVVTKLFAAVRPDVAVFGQKDAQQLAIIRRMNVDLDLGIEILALPTVRETDGLALSSRNRRLTAEDRIAAVCLSAGLHGGLAAHLAGERSRETLLERARGPIIAEPRARLEYLELVDPSTFRTAPDPCESGLLVVAAWFGDVRLIDNQPLG